MTIFYLPDLGEGLSEAEIVEWHVAEGDAVAREQLLLSVETAKAIVEIPAPQSGRIAKLFAAAGCVVPTGSPLVEFAEEANSATPAKPQEAPHTQEVPRQQDQGSVVGTMPSQTQESSDNFIIGRHRHTEARLQQHSQLPRQRAQTAAPAPAATEQFEGEALHGLRRHMADAMTESHREVALVTIFEEVIIDWKDEERPLHRLIRALCHAATAEPALNAWYDGARKERQLHEAVHIGIAMDTKAGLMVPTLRNAQKLDEAGLNRRIQKLKVAAVKRSLALSDMQGATITLSLHGSIGGRFATPLVSPPQVAILAAGTIFEQLAPDKKHGFKKVRLLPLSLSFDHRAVTGGEAARFLKAVMGDLGE